MSNPATHAAPPPPPQKLGIQPPTEDTALGLKPLVPGVVKASSAAAGKDAPSPIFFTEAFGGRVAVPGMPVLYWLVREGRLQPHPAYLYEPAILDPSRWVIAWVIAARSFTEMRDVPYSDVPANGCWTWQEAAVAKPEAKAAAVESTTPFTEPAKVDPPKSESKNDPKKNEPKK